MSSPRYMTVEDLAELTRVSPNTIRAWRHQRRGPKATKLGGRVLFACTDVDEWLAQNTEPEAATGA